MKTQRPRILFINSRPDRVEGTLPVIRGLASDYEVEEMIDLTRAALERVRRAETAGRPYDAIITHLPPGALWPRGYPYGQSLGIICDMGESTETPIIAYTAAVLSDVQPFAHRVVEIVQKGAVAVDLPKLRELLARTVGRPRRPAIPANPPCVVRRDGRTTVEATVALTLGISFNAIWKIIRLCENFPGDVILQKQDGDECEEANAKQFMPLAMLAAGRGEKVVISVAGTDPPSELLARKIHAIVTARFYWEVNLDRIAAPPAAGADPSGPSVDPAGSGAADRSAS